MGAARRDLRAAHELTWTRHLLQEKPSRAGDRCALPRIIFTLPKRRTRSRCGNNCVFSDGTLHHRPQLSLHGDHWPPASRDEVAGHRAMHAKSLAPKRSALVASSFDFAAPCRISPPRRRCRSSAPSRPGSRWIPEGRSRIAGSGQYYVAIRTIPRREIVIRRNRFYRGTRPRRVDRFVVDLRCRAGRTSSTRCWRAGRTGAGTPTSPTTSTPTKAWCESTESTNRASGSSAA